MKPLQKAEKANAHPLHEAIEAFLLTKRVGGCTHATLTTYRWWLERFAAAVPEATQVAVRAFFADLQHHGASTQHQAYRTLKTFLRWFGHDLGRLALRLAVSRGYHSFTVRCYDGDGAAQIVQPSEPRPSGATGLHSRRAKV